MKAVYIHIPYCIKKCNYCDFTSYSLDSSPVRPEDYVVSLKRELQMWSEIRKTSDEELSTIYFGGGTPTCLSTELLGEIMNELRSLFRISSDPEITLEVNPGTINFDFAKKICKLGFNRISLGAQAFQDALLKSMGRIHTVKDIHTAVYTFRRAGLSNINIDLIYGLPGQTIKQWKESIRKAICLEADHVSTYSLHLGPSVLWGKQVDKEELVLPSEELVVQMYVEAIRILSDSGYVQYEISNFSLPHKKCRHNQVYWKNDDYLGIGAGASSHVEGFRFHNTTSLVDYCSSLDRNELPIFEKVMPNRAREISETIFMSLRMMEGLDITEFYRKFGVRIEDLYGQEINKFLRWGYLEKRGDCLRLSCKAFPVANSIFMEFV